jgi:preprotein translocase subunit SecB
MTCLGESAFRRGKPPELRWDDFEVTPNMEVLSQQPQEEALFDKDRVRVQIRLKVRFQPTREGNAPYTFRIELLGFFNASATAKSTDPLSLLRVNGSAILFGAARQLVASVTSRGPFRGILLPSISFIPDALTSQSIQTKQESTELKK